VDQESGAEHVPLAHVAPGQGPFAIYDSLLSEYAALGFEYGYSLGDPTALVCWEAQFGDFVNGAQIVIDQYLAAAEDKWSQRSSLVLLLPHGFEGQGPEHSSGRIERFLILSAEDNMRVLHPSTPASYFHALRRQIASPLRVLPSASRPSATCARRLRSSVAELVEGAFQPVLDDPTSPPEPARILSAAGRSPTSSARSATSAGRGRRGAPREVHPSPSRTRRRARPLPRRRRARLGAGGPENMGAWSFVRGEVTDKPAGASAWLPASAARRHRQRPRCARSSSARSGPRLRGARLSARRGPRPRGQSHNQLGRARRRREMCAEAQHQDLGRRHQLHGVQPVLPVADVAASAEYFRDVLGFEIDFLEGNPPVHGRVMKGDGTYGNPIYTVAGVATRAAQPSIDPFGRREERT
jgi:hypothetical protein